MSAFTTKPPFSGRDFSSIGRQLCARKGHRSFPAVGAKPELVTGRPQNRPKRLSSIEGQIFTYKLTSEKALVQVSMLYPENAPDKSEYLCIVCAVSLRHKITGGSLGGARTI
jgi:hypothetical protein